MSTRHTIGAALCTLALAGVAGCGTSIEVSVPGQADGPVLSIGVALDEPGMSWYHNGAYSGFSVQVAQYVAKVLGYANKQIVFRNVPLDDRARVAIVTALSTARGDSLIEEPDSLIY